MEGVLEVIQEGAFALRTLTTDEVRVECQNALLLKDGFNSYADKEKPGENHVF